MSFSVSDRGFVQGQEIKSEYGGFVRVYESSSAEGPHIWVRVMCSTDLNKPFDREGDVQDACAHLTLDNAKLLRT